MNLINSLYKDNWITTVRRIEQYHLCRYDDDTTWTLRKTADELNRSVGSISEDLRLSLAIRIYPMIKEFHTKDAAINWLKFKNKWQPYNYRKWSIQQIEGILDHLESELNV